METWLLPAFLTLLALWNLSLVIRPEKRPGYLGVLPYFVLGAGSLQIWYQGFYWFLFPAYALAVLEALIHLSFLLRGPVLKSRLTGPLRAVFVVPALVAFLLAAAASSSFPLEAPAPSGPWTPAYRLFSGEGVTLGVYYPERDSGRKPAGPLPEKKYFWENHLESFDTGIRGGGRPPQGNWSLLVVHGKDSNGNGNILLWRELASWGFVVVMQEAESAGNDQITSAPVPPQQLESLGLKAFSRLGMNWSGTKAGLFFQEAGGQEWSARIFLREPPADSLPGTPDLVFSSGPVNDQVFTALWAGSPEPLLSDEPLVRPWLRYLGQQSHGAVELRQEAESLVRDFLLWKVRQGEPGIFSRPPDSSGRLRILTPRS